MKKLIGIIFFCLVVHFTGHTGRFEKLFSRFKHTKTKTMTKIKPRRFLQSFSKLKPKKIFPLNAKTKARITTISVGSTAIGYSWWDKIKEYFGYGAKVEFGNIVESIDNPDGDALSNIKYIENGDNVYRPQKGLIPYYPMPLKSLEGRLQNLLTVNRSITENGYVLECQKGKNAITTHSYLVNKTYTPMITTLKDSNGNIVARYVIDMFQDNTSEMVVSSLVAQYSIPEHELLLRYTEKQLITQNIMSMVNNTSREETDGLWKQWGYGSGIRGSRKVFV